MNRICEIQTKEFCNFTKHQKISSLLKTMASPAQHTKNQLNYKQQRRIQILDKTKKQFQDPTSVRSHRRVISMFTGEKQKKSKLQKLQVNPKSPIDSYAHYEKDQTPTFSLNQPVKQKQVTAEIKKNPSIFPLSFKKKNIDSHQNPYYFINAQTDKFEIIKEIIFFQNRLEIEMMKNKQLSNTYQQFLDENYQLKQLNLDHPNWHLYQENQQLKEKLIFLQQFDYPVTQPQTPRMHRIEVISKPEFLHPNEPSHNSPIRLLYPFQ